MASPSVLPRLVAARWCWRAAAAHASALQPSSAASSSIISVLPPTLRAFSSSSSSSSAPPSPAAPAGDSSASTQPVQFTGRALDEALIRKIGEKDAAMRAAYDRMPEAYPEHAQPDDGSKQLDAHAAFRKRLLYRSKQRGW
jgi:hypothetical protein